jgi:hypothetical protein
MKPATLFRDKKIIVTAGLYFLVSGILLFKFGVQLGGEADKIIDNANRIINGRELFNGVFGWFYMAYTLFIALFLKLSVSLVFVVIVQVVLSLFAAICLYKLLLQVLANRHIAFLFFLVYLLCYPIQKWNFFLYTEGIHTSLLVIGIYYCNKWLSEKKNIHLVVSAIILLLILFSRPVGILFLIALIVAAFFQLYQYNKKSWFYALAGIVITSLIFLLNSPYTAFVNPDSIRRMEIICQVPQSNDTLVYKEYNREGLFKAFSVVKDEVGFGTFFAIGFKKLGCFFSMYRSYFSWQHNLLLIAFTVFYPFALIGIFSKQRKCFRYVKLFAIIYALLTSIAIFFTCDEWSNRFISPVFPFILILAAAGFQKLFGKNLNPQ